MDDELMIAALRLAAGADPVPAGVTAAARRAHRLRLPGALTAAPQEVAPASGLRAGDEGIRTLRFAAAGFAVELEISAADGLVDLAGRVTPHPGRGTRVEIRTPHLSQTRELEATGQFAATALPPGWFSVVCRPPDGRPIATAWTRIRL